MSPITFNGCFGWLHTSQNDRLGDTAVLLCPGLNRDALDSHHSMRVLADEFAAEGYPTMRFNYPGTGDSCDLEAAEHGAVEHWAAWQQSVDDAADWLRRSTGAGRLILCGLRIGGTLAALAAQRRDDVAGLILLAPVIRGRSYMRQLLLEAQLRRGSGGPSRREIDFDELRLSAETVDLIDQADLRQVRLTNGQQVLICSQAPSKSLKACVSAWTQCGAEVKCAGFDGLEQMLRHNLLIAGPPADFSALLEWVRRAVPMQSVAQFGACLVDGVVLQLPGCVEIPMRFGVDDRLFGMLCRPNGRSTDLAVVIGNGGRDPHYGTSRFGVEFARRIAAEGIASLRMDFAGLGDSIGSAGKENVLSPLFDVDRTPDISAALDLLERLGYGQFAVQGLCAGAYHVFHGALADPRIGTLLLINMPVFTWRGGDAVAFVNRQAFSPARYLLKLSRKETWSCLLRGNSDVGEILLAQLARLSERVKEAGLLTAERLSRAGPLGFARRAVAKLSRRGARTLFLFASGDGGIDALERKFGRGGVRLRAFEGVALQIVPELDHMLSDRQMRRVAADLMLGFLTASPATAPRVAPPPDTDLRPAPSSSAHTMEICP